MKGTEFMLKIKVQLNNNRGSFAIDALAQTFQGDWDSRSSTESGGIITNVDDDARGWVEEVLEGDDNVESYTIAEQ